jgi:hypothetical protein
MYEVVIELTDGLLQTFRNALASVEYDYFEDDEPANSDLFLEFDGEVLKLYSNDYTYFEEQVIYWDYLYDIAYQIAKDNEDIQDGNIDLSKYITMEYIRPFKKKVKPIYLKECLEEIDSIGVRYCEIIIFTKNDLVYCKLVNKLKPSLYGLNIEYSYYMWDKN